MGLVQNLKKTLSSLAEKILVELCYQYIKQVAKQTSKKQNNSLSTESLPNHLTQEDLPTTIVTSSAGTSEKITMETTIEPVVQVRDWVIQKIKDTDDYDTAIALVAEFEEWLDLDGKDEIDYLCIETDEWGEQELDVR